MIRNGENRAAAAVSAGYSAVRANQSGYQLMQNEIVVNHLENEKKRISLECDLEFKKRIEMNKEVYALSIERDEKGAPRELLTAHKVNQNLSEIFGDYAPKCIESNNTNHNLNVNLAVELVEKYEQDY